MEIRSISLNAALRVAAVVLGLIIALRFLWIARAIFIVTFLGVLLGLAVARAVDFLERFHIRRGFGAPIVILGGVGILIAIGAFTAPTVREQTRELSRELPKSVEEIDRWLDRTPAKAILGNPQQKQTGQAGAGITAQLGREMRSATKFLFPILSSTFAAAGGAIIVLFIAMYIGATPGLYREGVLHLVPQRNRERATEVLATLRDTLRQWLIARLIAMVAIGAITGVGLALLKVKGAVALGILAGLLEFVPFFGPFVSAVPALGIALVDSPTKALYVGILYLVVQQLEGNVITPLLLEKRLDIPPVLTVVAVSALGVVFGVLGMLIAEPLLAAVLVTTKMLYVQDVVGDEVKVGKAAS
ncbi:MAG TPA: AI-2E family transporter [Thermoanaerobaculia bacterium]